MGPADTAGPSADFLIFFTILIHKQADKFYLHKLKNQKQLKT